MGGGGEGRGSANTAGSSDEIYYIPRKEENKTVRERKAVCTFRRRRPLTRSSTVRRPDSDALASLA